MNARRLPSGEIAGDCVLGSAANASTGGGCATATVPKQSAANRTRQRLFMALLSLWREIDRDCNRRRSETDSGLTSHPVALDSIRQQTSPRSLQHDSAEIER